MSDPCDRTPDVERAHATGEWTAALSDHALACPSCGDARLALGFLATLSRVDIALDEPPPAATLFRGHRLAEQLRCEQREVERAIRPLRFAEIAAAVVAFVGAVFLAGRAGGSSSSVALLWFPTAVLLLASGSVLARSLVREAE